MMKLPLAQITKNVKTELGHLQSLIREEEKEKEEISEELNEKMKSLKELKAKLEEL